MNTVLAMNPDIKISLDKLIGFGYASNLKIGRFWGEMLNMFRRFC